MVLHAPVAGDARGILHGADQAAVVALSVPQASGPGPSTGPMEVRVGAPYGTRTRVSAVKGRCPRPLDEGRLRRGDIYAATYRGVCEVRQGSPITADNPHHLPLLGMDAHGSCDGSGAPFCNNSIECLSGERTNAITPSRGGRLMVTPAFINFSHRA